MSVMDILTDMGVAETLRDNNTAQSKKSRKKANHMPKAADGGNKSPETDWTYDHRITLDYETTVLTAEQDRAEEAGEVKREDLLLFAYSAQVCLRRMKTDEKGKLKTEFDCHIFYDARLPRTAEDGDYYSGQKKYTVVHHAVPVLENGECGVVSAMIEWLMDFFADKSKSVIFVEAYAYNAGFEESYSLFDLLSMGFDSDKVIPRSMGGVMISIFNRISDRRKQQFIIKETAGLWGANDNLSKVFKRAGLGAKEETPFLCWTEETGFYNSRTGAPAVIDADFTKYASKDVVGLYQVLMSRWVDNGNTKNMTASSATLQKHKEWFIEKHSEQEYEQYFRGATMEADTWLREYSLGGYNYTNPEYEGRYQHPKGDFGRFMGIDRTNAYLSVMCKGTFPWGQGFHGQGEFVAADGFDFGYQKILIKTARLKYGYMPPLQWKHGVADDVLMITGKTREEDRIFILTQEELALVKESYADLSYKCVDYYAYKSVSGDFLFGEYLKKRFYERKTVKEKIAALEEICANSAGNASIAADIIALGGLSELYKLEGNGLYGKFFENPNKELGFWWLNEKTGELLYFDEQTIMEKHSPSHIGSQVLRLQRLALIKACNKVIAAGGEIFQCDTDAFLCGIPREMMNNKEYKELKSKDSAVAARKIAEIAGLEYGDDLGQWHIEKDAREGITAGKKCYLWFHDALTDEQRQMKIADIGKVDKDFWIGAKGVKNDDALKQLSPREWKGGAEVRTTQFVRLARGRRGQVHLTKTLISE